MREVRLFVYDFDGTLVDSKLDIADSVNCALKELGVRELPRETIFGYIGNGVEALMARALAGVTPAGKAPGGDAAMTLRDCRNANPPRSPIKSPPPPFSKGESGKGGRGYPPFIKGGLGGFHASASAGGGVGPGGSLALAVEAFKKHYGVRYLDQTRFYPHCRETVDSFSDKKHAIFSNKPLQFIEKILAGLDFLHPFASILGGDSLEARKPDPQGLVRIMDALRIPAGETVMVGDTPLDVETGRRAGVLTCAVTYGLGERTDLERARPGWMIDDFSQLREIFC